MRQHTIHKFEHGLALVVGDLQEDHAARVQVRVHLSQQALENVEPFRPRLQSKLGLVVPHIALEGLVFVMADVGQVRRQYVHHFRQRLQQVPMQKSDLLACVTLGNVLPRDGERIFADVCGVDFRLWAVRGNRQRNGSAACAYVGHCHAPVDARLDVVQYGIHQQFRLRARDQHTLVDGKFQPVELLLADEIGHRL